MATTRKRKRYTVSVVNPSPKRRRKKTSKRRAKKKTATRRKPATRKPTKKKAKTMARRRRRKTTTRRTTRRRAPARRRRRTRSNPRRVRRAASRVRGAGRRMTIDPFAPFDRDMFARLAGKVLAVWAVKRYGSAFSGPNSPTTGGNWTWNNYLLALGAAWLGGTVMGRAFKQPAIGKQMYQGAADLTATKWMWSEVIMRWPAMMYGTQVQTALGQTSRGYPSFGGAAYPSFGNVPSGVQALFAQSQPGDIVDDGAGNRWLNRGGRMVAMMGADSYDGMAGEIVEAGPLGAEIVEAGPLGAMVEAGPLGHMMPAASTSADEMLAAYTFRGSKDPYRAAYM